MLRLRNILFAILALSICACSKTYRVAVGSQREDMTQNISVSEIASEAASDENSDAFVEHESTPEFPGGPSAMLRYIHDNLKYPKEAYDNKIQGRVVVSFLVSKTGEVDSIRIVRGYDPSLAADALMVV